MGTGIHYIIEVNTLYLWVQWAAVKMCLFVMKVPPQNQVELNDNPTIQANSSGWAWVPPTILSATGVPQSSNPFFVRDRGFLESLNTVNWQRNPSNTIFNEERNTATNLFLNEVNWNGIFKFRPTFPHNLWTKKGKGMSHFLSLSIRFYNVFATWTKNMVETRHSEER